MGSLCLSIQEGGDEVGETTQDMVSSCGSITDCKHFDSNKCMDGRGKKKGALCDRDGQRVHRHTKESLPLHNMKQVIPVVIGQQSGKIWYVEKTMNGNKLHECRRVGVDSVEHCGAWYFKYEEIESNDWVCGLFNPENCLCGLMMQHVEKKSMYYTVRTDWKELLLDAKTGRALFGWPRFRKAVYNMSEDEERA